MESLSLSRLAALAAALLRSPLLSCARRCWLRSLLLSCARHCWLRSLLLSCVRDVGVLLSVRSAAW